jgi:hypothetical protein
LYPKAKVEVSGKTQFSISMEMMPGDRCEPERANLRAYFISMFLIKSFKITYWNSIAWLRAHRKNCIWK